MKHVIEVAESGLYFKAHAHADALAFCVTPTWYAALIHTREADAIFHVGVLRRAFPKVAFRHVACVGLA